MRAKNFLRHFGISVTRVYDGGIAPRTLVPHWVHFAEYYKFHDVDPLSAIRHSELEPQEDLVKLILRTARGLGPGRRRRPDDRTQAGDRALSRSREPLQGSARDVRHLGQCLAHGFGDKTPRGAVQFNVACDPLSSNFILMGLDCPIYLMPTEVTRVKEIGFFNVQKLREALPDNDGTPRAVRSVRHVVRRRPSGRVRTRTRKSSSSSTTWWPPSASTLSCATPSTTWCR